MPRPAGKHVKHSINVLDKFLADGTLEKPDGLEYWEEIFAFIQLFYRDRDASYEQFKKEFLPHLEWAEWLSGYKFSKVRLTAKGREVLTNFRKQLLQIPTDKITTLLCDYSQSLTMDMAEDICIFIYEEGSALRVGASFFSGTLDLARYLDWLDVEKHIIPERGKDFFRTLLTSALAPEVFDRLAYLNTGEPEITTNQFKFLLSLIPKSHLALILSRLPNDLSKELVNIYKEITPETLV